MKGTYCLILLLPEDTNITIGQLGTLHFYKGYYTYVGSALLNMEKRLQRHIANTKKVHWHIDYFLEHARIIDIAYIESSEKLECSLARIISALPFSHSIPHFGSSDCSCPSHLFYFSSPCE